MEVQRAPSAIINSFTEAKEFNKLKIVKTTYKDKTLEDPQRQKCSQSICTDTVVAAISQDNAWPMGRGAQNAATLATSE